MGQGTLDALNARLCGEPSPLPTLQVGLALQRVVEEILAVGSAS